MAEAVVCNFPIHVAKGFVVRTLTAYVDTTLYSDDFIDGSVEPKPRFINCLQVLRWVCGSQLPWEIVG